MNSHKPAAKLLQSLRKDEKGKAVSKNERGIQQRCVDNIRYKGDTRVAHKTSISRCFVRTNDQLTATATRGTETNTATALPMSDRKYNESYTK